MQSLIHADIFFFVATIAVAIICIGLAIALVFVILILRNVHKISETVKTEAGLLAEDIDSLRSKSKSLSWSIAFKLFKNFFINRNRD